MPVQFPNERFCPGLIELWFQDLTGKRVRRGRDDFLLLSQGYLLLISVRVNGLFVVSGQSHDEDASKTEIFAKENNKNNNGA